MLVAGGEAGKAIWEAIGVAGSGVAAGEAVAVEGVEGELIDVDTPAEEDGRSGQQSEEEEEIAMGKGRGAELRLDSGLSLLHDGCQREHEPCDEDRWADEGEDIERHGRAGFGILGRAAGEGAFAGEDADERGSEPAQPEGFPNLCDVEEIGDESRTHQRRCGEGEPQNAEQKAPGAEASEPLAHGLIDQVADESAGDLDGDKDDGEGERWKERDGDPGDLSEG